MRRVGLEHPEQLGALFIADADFLDDLIGDTPPLVDDRPKRIEAPFGSTGETERLLSGFLDTAGARERFQNSAFIARLWPEQLVTASLPFFEIQEAINAVLYQELVWGPVHLPPLDPAGTIELTHRLLSGPPVAAPILWLWGSSADVQEVIAAATDDERAALPLQFDLGVRLLSEREYLAAADRLGRAEQLEEFYWDGLILRVYALCMAGAFAEAQRLAQERFGAIVRQQGVPPSALSDSSLPPDWLWLKQTFGIDPLAGVRTE
jgi:hypothetical protein